jgi:hypothetical protein
MFMLASTATLETYIPPFGTLQSAGVVMERQALMVALAVLIAAPPLVAEIENVSVVGDGDAAT